MHQIFTADLHIGYTLYLYLKRTGSTPQNGYLWKDKINSHNKNQISGKTYMYSERLSRY